MDIVNEFIEHINKLWKEQSKQKTQTKKANKNTKLKK